MYRVAIGRTIRIVVLISLAMCSPSAAQVESTLRAYPAGSAIAAGGDRTDAVWRQRDNATNFRQYSPHEGAPSSHPTHVHVLYDAENIYVHVYLYDEKPELIQRTLGRRDELNQADWFMVSIDSQRDQQTAYVFAVNAAGVQYDGIRTGSDAGPDDGIDTSWDAIWHSGVEIVEDGWLVQMQIPYAMLRFPHAEEQTWGIHFTRIISRLGEQAEWPLVPRTERSNLVARYGILQGMRGISPRRNLQVQPYVTSRLESGMHPDLHGSVERSGHVSVGGDLKIGLGSNVTMDATVNPDFGELESDPAVLNLTAFETRHDELRPFFIEGTQIYDFPLGGGGRNLLYTRRIGASAPIIGAAKLSGRRSNGLSFGFLGASVGDRFKPHQNYGVIRLSQQIGRYSSAGGILTGTQAEAGRRAITGGADWDFRTANNRYGVEGFFAFSHQRISDFDGNPGTGIGGAVSGLKRQGIWTLEGGLIFFDDKFDSNETGRINRTDFVRIHSQAEHQMFGGQPFGPFQRATARSDAWQQWSYRDGLDLGTRFRFMSEWTLRTFQTISVAMRADNLFGGYDLYETRGLGPRFQPATLEISGGLETDGRKHWQLAPEFTYSLHDDGGSAYELEVGASWNIGGRILLTGIVATEWENGVTAWSSNEEFARRNGEWFIKTDTEDGTDADFLRLDNRGLLNGVFSIRQPAQDTGHFPGSIFGARDTRSLDLTLRTNVTFTPRLSFELYSQLFLARGRYTNFHILQNADTLVPFSDFPKRDNFSLGSFQANAVLYWEFQPGSRLYIVWSQNRSREDRLNPLASWHDAPYEQSVGRQVINTFQRAPATVFSIKLNYTFRY